MSDNLNQEQPPPTQGTGPDCWELVLADMAERRQVGIAKYGTALRPDNGRDGLVDAYQEVLDLAVYLRQAIEQRKAMEAELARLQAIFDAPRVMLFADGREPTTNERHLSNLLGWAQKSYLDQKAETSHWMNVAHAASGADEIERLKADLVDVRDDLKTRTHDLECAVEENLELLARVKALEALEAQAMERHDWQNRDTYGE